MMPVMLSQQLANSKLWIHGIGVLAPGLNDWLQTQAVLRRETSYTYSPTVLPIPEMLQAAERRRASRVIKLCMALGQQAVENAGANISQLATIFSSSNADGHTIAKMCETLTEPERLISPTQFHNSVHNTASGYWCIAAQVRKPSQVICAYDATFSAGLLEASIQALDTGEDVLFFSYDSEYPAPLHSARPIKDCGGIAMVIGARPQSHSLASFQLGWSDAPVSEVRKPDLKRLAANIPALQGLSLLEALALRVNEEIRVPTMTSNHLSIAISEAS